MPSRILALDHGTKRIGVALSDELGWTAQPLETYERRTLDLDIAHILDLVRTHDVGKVLLGLPLRMSGEEGLAVQAVHQFLERLAEALPVPVVTWDERLTTADAHELLIAADVGWRKRKGLVDQIAAAILLQSYLEAQSPSPVQSQPTETEEGLEPDHRHHEPAGRPYEAARDSHRARPRRRPRRGGRLSDDEMG
ncbi:MAG: Holliday junction resolvase RuvX [Nitrospira sp.]|nr:Holliday junction resolvase RuvX [Nitrospira sp.]